MLLHDKKFFFCGIGGIGMSALAGIVFQNYSKNITGSNLKDNLNVQKLIKDYNIFVNLGHNPLNITDDIDYFVYSDAVPKDNCEYLMALEKKLCLISRGELLATLSQNFKTNINVIGTHGKTTTTSMMGFVLDYCKQEPTIVSGGIIKNYNSNFKLGLNDYCVIEADESNNSCLLLKTDLLILTSIEDDHMEYHKTRERLLECFATICNLTNKAIIICDEYPLCHYIIDKLSNLTYLRYGFDKDQNKPDLYASNIRHHEHSITFDVIYENKPLLHDVQIFMFGAHNVLNALAVIAVGLIEKIDLNAIKEALFHFKGVGNRFDFIGEVKKSEDLEYLIFNDYAHNPTKIKSAIDSLVHFKEQNNKYSHHNIVVIFEPHRYSRVRDSINEFATVFTKADQVLVLDIYSAFEVPIPELNRKMIAGNIANESYVEVYDCETSSDAVRNWLLKQKNSLVMFTSAGNCNLAYEVFEMLKIK